MSSGIALTSLGCVARASDEAGTGRHEETSAIGAAAPDSRTKSGIATDRAPVLRQGGVESSSVGTSAGDHAAAPAPIDTTLDPRSAAAITTLLPAAQRAARRLLAAANDGRLGPGVQVKIICGTRTYAEQTALYAQGRTTPGPIVTDAPAGYSWHNFGIAFDVGVFLSGEYQDDSPLYAKVGALGRSQGLEWGGDWVSFADEAHFQLPWASTLAEAREQVAAGKWTEQWANA